MSCCTTWHRVFAQDVREPFPLPLLDTLHWQWCIKCGTGHARSVCPQCTPAAPAAVREVIRKQGTVTTRRLFHTSGLMVYAAMQDGTLAWLYHEQDQLRREDGRAVLHGALDPQMHYWLCGHATLLGKDGQVITMVPEHAPERLRVDSTGARPLFDANARARYWTARGQLRRDGPWGPVYIGDVLEGQTHFWVGPRFGFGLYRAGDLSVAFLFDAERRGINDTVRLPPLRGHWVDARCVFTDTHCWLLVATQSAGQDGAPVCAAERAGYCRGHGPGRAIRWLLAGHAAGEGVAGSWLFAPTDEGIVRVEPQHGQLVQTRVFPDTEPYVDSGCHLFAGQQGMYVVDRQNIYVLTIA